MLKTTFWMLLVALSLAACSARDSSLGIELEWTTATETDTAGFNLYRGERPEGPFVKINDAMIPSSPDPLVGGQYHYSDHDVVPGKTYYYQLEDVEFTGVSVQHGPITVTAPYWFGIDAQAGNLVVFALGGMLALGIAVLVRRRFSKL
jgi:hypothetical protein